MTDEPIPPWDAYPPEPAWAPELRSILGEAIRKAEMEATGVPKTNELLSDEDMWAVARLVSGWPETSSYRHVAETLLWNVQRLKLLEADARETLRSEQQSVAVWMFTNGYATGHGDTTASMLSELEAQAVQREHKMLNRIARIDGDAFMSMTGEKAGTFDDCIRRLGALDDLTRLKDWKT